MLRVYTPAGDTVKRDSEKRKEDAHEAVHPCPRFGRYGD